MRSKSQTAWEAAAKCAMLAQEADDPQEREHYARLRDAWITLARRCEPFAFPDVMYSENWGDAPSLSAKRGPPRREMPRRGLGKSGRSLIPQRQSIQWHSSGPRCDAQS